MTKRLKLLSSLVLATGLLAVLAPSQAAAHPDPDCTALGGVITLADECEVQSSQTAKAGTYNIFHTLIIKAGVQIDATTPGTGGITINISGAGNDLVMESGSAIEANDPSSPPNDSARPITITVPDDMTMMAGSTLAENNSQGGSGADISLTIGDDFTMQSGSEISSSRNAGTTTGSGGDIAIDVGGDMLMEANTIIHADGQNPAAGDVTINVDGDMTMKGTAGPLAGAIISATGSFGDTAGDITIHVGNFPNIPPTGVFTQETGAVVTASSGGPAGEIIITAGREMSVDGSVLSESGQSGTGAIQPPGGGPITLQAGCGLTVSDTGLVSSRGQDPGADLVHLEACEVLIQGVVRSFAPGAGHVIPTGGNRCNDDTTAHPTNGAAGFTGCVEIWAKNVTIDNTGTHNGEVHTDGIRNPMRGWVDVFAQKDVSILGDPTTPYPTTFDANAFVYTPPYAVHANACPASDGQAPCSNSFGGLITVKSLDGKVAASGRALQATATALGADGGDIVVEAGGAAPAGEVDLDSASLQATGPSGSNTAGGSVSVRSWEDDVLGVPPGEIKVAGDGLTDPGTITLTACMDVNYTGSTDRTPTVNEGAPFCGTGPTIPASVLSNFALRAALWDACDPQEGVKKGQKFNDLDGDGVKDAGEPGLPNWTIHIFGTTNDNVVVHEDILTDANGNYEITLPPGTYTACEELQTGWVQTFPNPGSDGNACEGHNHLGSPGAAGYTFTIVGGDTHEGNDFGNRKLECEKGPVKDVLNPTTGRFPGNAGPDVIVRIDLGQSVQDAVDNVSDVNGDQKLIILVLKDGTGQLGGHTSQEVVIDDAYSLPFGLIGCSVTLHDPTPNDANPTIRIASSAGSPQNIFLMDLHAADSKAAGIAVEGNGRYLRNENVLNNAVGFKITGNANTVHNGAATGNTGAGANVQGDSNVLTDTDSYSNGVGFQVTGNNNQLLKLDAGDKGKGNLGDGVNVNGANNLLSEIGAFANGGDGIDVTGNTNRLLKNVAGDSGKGNGADGIHLAGSGATIQENKASSNKTTSTTGDGFDISGGVSAAPNKLKNNSSNTGSSGSSTHENGGAEYRLLNYVRNDGGGNKADGVVVPKTTSPVKCNAGATQFPAMNVTLNLMSATACE